MRNKTILVLLVVFNSIVLLGQVWPEGAPPFARIVNIVTLLLNLLAFLTLLRNRKTDSTNKL